TMRRFPNAIRALGEALGSERWPVHPSWSGERVLDPATYADETPCDWTSGSFMLARREALLGAGILDERFFIYREEADLCLRMSKAGWETFHFATMTILHHAGKGGVNPRMEAQGAYARLLHARKHFGRAHRALYVAALCTRYGIRSFARNPARRSAMRRSLKTLLGLERPPFGEPPAGAVAPAPAAFAASEATNASPEHDERALFSQ